MANKFEVEIVSRESSLSPAEQDDLRYRRQQQSRKEAKDARIEEDAHLNRQIKLQREADRQADRQRRLDKQARDEERSERVQRRADENQERARDRERDRRANQARAERDRQHRRDQGVIRARERAVRRRRAEAERDANRQIVQDRRAVTMRRRFINDMFGTFNNAHMGRRVNHAIDFVQRVFGGPLAGEPGSLRGAGGGGGSAAGSRTSNTVNNVSNSVNNATAARNTYNYFRGNRRSSGPTGGTPRASSAAPTNVNPMYRGAAGVPNQAVPTARIVGQGAGTAGRFASGVARLAGPALSNPVGLVALGALATLAQIVGGVSAAFIVANNSVTKFADALTQAGIPSALTFAKVDRELAVFAQNLSRGEEFGQDLADIERSKTKMRLTGMSIQDSMQRAFIPLTKAGNELLAKIYGIMQPFIESFFEVAIKPIMEILAKLVTATSDSLDWWIAKIGEWQPWLGAVLSSFAQANAGNNSNIQRDIFKWMNEKNANTPNSKKAAKAYNAHLQRTNRTSPIPFGNISF